MNGLPGARRIRRRTASGLWSLVMNFDLPDILAANKAGALFVQADGVTPVTSGDVSVVSGRFGQALGNLPIGAVNFSAIEDWAVAATAMNAGAPWTLELWARSVSAAPYLNIGGSLSHPLVDTGETAASWRHFALCRPDGGGSAARFIDGASAAFPIWGGYPIWLSSSKPSGLGAMDLEIDALRFVVGAALYTAPFTPPTAPP